MSAEVKARRYRAFIAYAHRDRRWAAWLHRRLEFYRVPRRLVGRATPAGKVPRRLGPIFRDREELASSADLGESINAALDRSDALILVCSPAAARSRWVNEEVARFRRGRADSRIFCLIVAGDAASEECFPPALREDAQGGESPESGTAEPLAADLRREGDGRKLALLKLVAGLLGVDLDELRRREAQRQVRRWSAVAVLAIAVTAATSLLAFEAMIQRNAADRQRAQAEGLVSFMLGNLRNELEPIGRLDLLDMIGKRALAYYAAQNPDTLDADSLARRAKALLLIGQVYDQRGKLSDALPAFQEAARTTEKLLARKPNDAQRIYDHAQSVYWLGYIAYQRGRTTKAKTEFGLYQTLAERLVAIDPDKAEWQTELEYASSNLGTLLLNENDSIDAADAFHKALEVAERLVRKDPGNAQRQMDLAQSRAWLADSETHLGRFDDAGRQRRAELAIYDRLLTADPANTSVRESRVASQRALAAIAMAQGDLDGALKRAHGANADADYLVARDSSNADWQNLEAGALTNAAQILLYRGDISAASTAALRAEAIVRALTDRSPGVVVWQAVLGQSRLLRARVAAGRDDHATALLIIRKSISGLVALPPKMREDEQIRELFLYSYLFEGDQLHALGKSGSRAAWQAALRSLGRGDRRAPFDVRTAIAAACLRLGERARADAIVADLDASHYRAPDFLRLKRQIADSDAAAANPRSREGASKPHLQPEGN
ncbi:MAG TPA: TIR domain-containing protein [Gammaproteobacteria bacterium]|nr:TIR domain-containing protein [Gammaproteobacteria bacterium]